ncbi:hypothetical protein [Aeromicrobium sp. 50.2.37]|uniref:hypothetical protein n=1 Tax=Aeromicrobium sp. 50.2.37 TaxID=2969305 RepID=UPI00215024E4|nr:hypothetical protein [Aeromicrobium sp. 50.2.37]MCR4512107.1 hypothetical protein [Aeromicrobium sp. 50.2.37]
MTRIVVQVASVVPAPREVVWARVTSVEGIDHELRPWLSMTLPRDARGLDVHSLPVGVPLGRAWIRLFGVLPVEYDDLTVVELDHGRRFHEVSRMLSARRWEHERTLTPGPGGGTHVHDRLTVEPRFALAAPVVRRLVGALFGHRHRRLARWCAARSTGP